MHNIFQKKYEKCYETNADIYMSLLLIRSIPISPRLPCQATLLFNRPMGGILLGLSRPAIPCDNDENNLALINSQPQLK